MQVMGKISKIKTSKNEHKLAKIGKNFNKFGKMRAFLAKMSKN